MSKPLKYFGGKSPMIKRLLPLLPKITHFRSAFVGSGSLEFYIDPINKSEIWNDLDSELTNFYEVLRGDSSFKEFQKLCELTPFSEEVFEISKLTSNLPLEYFGTSVHRAWLFFIKNRFSRGGCGISFATSTSRLRRSMNENVSSWLSCIDGLNDFHQRLKYVEIRKMDFRYFIDKFDRDTSFFYLDPPYPQNTRIAGGYSFEMTDSDHLDLLNKCKNLSGKFLLHTYPNKVYIDFAVENNFNIKEFELTKSSSSSKTKPLVKELVITNYLK